MPIKKGDLKNTLGMKLVFLAAETLEEGGGKTEYSSELKLKMLEFSI